MNLVIRNRSGERIDYRFSSGNPASFREGVLVLLGHGVTGDKDRPILVETARALNDEGFSTMRFSFSGNGGSEGDFREATITKETNDLDAILDAVADSCSQVVYIGHSMGGAVGVKVAARDPRIHFLISLAGMVDTRAFAEAEFGGLVPDKDVMWEEESCPLSSAFMKDLCKTVRSVESEARQIRIPWLLVHGTEDDVVQPGDSTGLKQQLGGGVDLVTVEGADHVFSTPEHMRAATTAVVNWLISRT